MLATLVKLGAVEESLFRVVTRGNGNEGSITVLLVWFRENNNEIYCCFFLWQAKPL